MRKLRVLFVASFCRMPDGGTGGQTTVATNVLHSKLQEIVELVPLDSTMQTVPAPSQFARSLAACRRMVSYLRLLPSSDVVLIFASSGASLVEKGLMAGLARACGRGVVLRISSGRVQHDCERSWRMQFWLKGALNACHVLISQGPFWTEYFGRYISDEEKIIEIPNGTVIPDAPPRLPGFPRQPHLLYVGWMVRSKGIFEALAVAQELRRVYPDLVLSMVGGGNLEPFRAAVNAAAMQDNVRILGWQSAEQVQRLLTETDVFLLPSHFEGLPNALLEAMASGVPVVATPVGCVRDLINSGENGLLVPVGDVAATADAVAGLLRDREFAARIGEHGRQTVSRECDINLLWSKYAEAISRAARESGHQGLPRPMHELGAATETTTPVGRER